jgi:hypothetical protein
VACPKPGDSPASLETSAPQGPFSSGQIITVEVGPNRILERGAHIYIRECAAPRGVPPTSPRQCDLRTTQRIPVFVGRHGTVDFVGYPVFALPDAPTLGEPPDGHPVCNLTHPCVLFIGQDRTDFDQPHVWSLPFSVTVTAGDTGADPGDGQLPEVSYAILFPVLALGILVGAAWLRRRRTATRA